MTIISGPVGVGKTQLLRGFAAEAVEAGALFLGGNALRPEQFVPLGVLRQALASVELPADQANQASQLLTDAAFSVKLHDGEEVATERSTAPMLDKFASILVEVSEHQPLVVGIDDAHFADVASLYGLLYLARRAAEARVMVVLNVSVSCRQLFPALWAELRNQPNFDHVPLGLLTESELATMLAAGPELPDACSPALCQQITGGNPRLLAGLLSDFATAWPGAENPTSTTGLAQAVLSCLSRSDPALLPLAQALAVLDGPATPTVFSELLDVSESAAQWAMDMVTEAGLLDNGRLRHEHIRTAVLNATGQQDRAELHKRVARLLFRNGASALAVARHKIAAGQAAETWSTGVLHEAANQAFESEDAGLALDCLRLAERGEADATERASTSSLIMRAKWRFDPIAAERDIEKLVEASQDGVLTGRSAIAVVNLLLWYGRPLEAGKLFERVRDSMATDDHDLITALYGTGMRMAFLYPGYFDRTMVERIGLPRFTTTTGKMRLRAANVLDTIMTKGFTKEALDDTEDVLHQLQLTDSNYDAITSCLEVLVLADHVKPAAHWCDALLAQAEDRQIATWCAHLSGIRATISLRQGNLAEAERHGRAALSYVSPRGLGIWAGLPLSVLLTVSTRTGQASSAQRYLDAPVPDAMLQTPVGLQYLRARGRYYLSRRSHRAAIEDFEACGNLMMKWGLDLPGIAPWRTDLAEANLRIGLPGRDLAVEQLARIGSYNNRTRGITLRVLAATSEFKERQQILQKSIRILTSCDDRVELADALTELSEVQYALKKYDEARENGRRGRDMAARAKVTNEGQPADAAEERTQPLVSTEEDWLLRTLTHAELRVASLAARGHSNREIARKLYVTVSTVEQHLTHVYRKLQVSRRSNLPDALLGHTV